MAGKIPSWQPSMSLGNPELDAQHILLLEFAKQLLELIEADFGSDLIKTKASEFLAHLQAHSVLEEQTLERNSCPGLADHRAEHEAHHTKLSDLSKIVARDRDSRAAFATAIADWANELIKVDQQDREYLKLASKETALET